jgi:hypothetical protein
VMKSKVGVEILKSQGALTQGWPIHARQLSKPTTVHLHNQSRKRQPGGLRSCSRYIFSSKSAPSRNAAIACAPSRKTLTFPQQNKTRQDKTNHNSSEPRSRNNGKAEILFSTMKSQFASPAKGSNCGIESPDLWDDK